MSRLKLFCPVSDEERIARPLSGSRLGSGPEIVPFRPRRGLRVSTDPMLEVVLRAQTIRDNCACPECNHPIVEPIELNDAGLNRNGMPIPGTATLVGFRCGACTNEWPV